MQTHKLAALLPIALLPLLLSAGPTAESRIAAAKAPDISPIDQRFLTQIIRRTLVATEEDETYEPDYVPPALAKVQCQIVVILRLSGYACGIGVSDRQPVAAACQQAARLALESASVAGMSGLDFVNKIRIDVAAAGELQPYTGPGNWSDPGVLESFLDPGIHGVGVALDEEQRWCTPGEMIAKNVPLGEAVRTLAKEVSFNPQAMSDATISRFRTVHWWEVEPGKRVVTLRRGMVVLDADQVTASSVDEAISRLARYMLYRQLPAGRFSYRYKPSADEYDFKPHDVTQAAAAWAMAFHASQTGEAKFRESADRVIAELSKHIIDLPTVDGAAFVATPDEKNKLGITAQLCLALADAPQPERYDAVRQRLSTAMCWLQLSSGRLATAFPPAQVLPTPDLFPGQALAALARCYELSPQKQILEVFDNALPFYRELFDEHSPPLMVPWHTQAFGIMARMTKQQAYTDFVFAMNDRVCEHQLGPSNCDSPELWGAIAAPNLPPGASTAELVIGLADAAQLARHCGDGQRFERYRDACRAATRFVMQLMIRKDECYFVKSTHDAVDGVRTNPVDWDIRIDDCGYALVALDKARTLLFPVRP